MFFKDVIKLYYLFKLLSIITFKIYHLKKNIFIRLNNNNFSQGQRTTKKGLEDLTKARKKLPPYIYILI